MEDFTKHSTMSNDGRFGPEKVDVLCRYERTARQSTTDGIWLFLVVVVPYNKLVSPFSRTRPPIGYPIWQQLLCYLSDQLKYARRENGKYEIYNWTTATEKRYIHARLEKTTACFLVSSPTHARVLSLLSSPMHAQFNRQRNMYAVASAFRLAKLLYDSLNLAWETRIRISYPRSSSSSSSYS